jgi:transposase InsO family protein
MAASMSRKADCFDNAPMESSFHTLKTELVHHRQYATRADARRDIFAFIEGFYNRTRLHSAIGYISPIVNWHWIGTPRIASSDNVTESDSTPRRTGRDLSR